MQRDGAKRAGNSFANLGFVKPAGATFLRNFISSLQEYNVTVFSSDHENQRRPAFRFLDDSLFFQSHLGAPLNRYATPRQTTRPLVQPAGSSHPYAARSQASFRPKCCTIPNNWRVRLIRAKSCERSQQAGQDFSRGVLVSIHHHESHSWLRQNLVPWLANRLGTSEASLYRFQVCASELFNNIQDHTDLEIGCIFAQHFSNRNRVNISVAGFGCCIPAAVRQVRPALNGVDAIIKAVERGFTAKGVATNQGEVLAFR
jgi:hypothetical protein